MQTTTNGIATAVSRRLAGLRQTAYDDPDAARHAAWEWLLETRDRAARGRSGTVSELDQLFRLGQVPQGLDGTTEGILVTPLIHPLVDFAVRSATAVWMPWQGKAFDVASSRGVNHLAGSTRYVGRLLWPRYTTTARPGGRAAFRFETYVAPAKRDPDVRALVIDYERVGDNPFLIRRVRDELVQLVPGAFLGKILFRGVGRNAFANIGFFALRDPH
jgi:hypothetical protein